MSRERQPHRDSSWELNYLVLANKHDIFQREAPQPSESVSSYLPWKSRPRAGPQTAGRAGASQAPSVQGRRRHRWVLPERPRRGGSQAAGCCLQSARRVQARPLARTEAYT